MSLTLMTKASLRASKMENVVRKMKMVITTTTTLSGMTYAVVVPKKLIASYKQGLFTTDILSVSVIYNLPLSEPKIAAGQLVRLAQMYGNAELIDVPSSVQEYRG
jgi:hypothetical protein